MKFNSVLATVTGAICLGQATAAAAPLPADQAIEYNIRDIPTDPESDVVFTVTIELTAVDVVDNSVAWKVTSAKLYEAPSVVKQSAGWTDGTPSVEVLNGLWWVDHADPLDPQLDEFAIPPHIHGTADSNDPSHKDLDYTFEGATYTPPPGGPPFNPTGALTYNFTLVNEEEPIEEAEDEPVEISELVQDPD